MRTSSIGCVVAAWLLHACAPLPNDNAHLEGPLDGLTPQQSHAFVLGDQDFSRFFTPEEGLGPRFNAASCTSCHPADGAGHPSTALVRFGYLDEHGFDPLRALGGPQWQDKALPGFAPEKLPPIANVFSELIGNPVTGLGLLESVDDADILALADPEDRNGDGISGRPHWIPSSDAIEAITERDRATLASPQRWIQHDGHYLGRFGRKASAVSLLHQTVTALREDMGLTSDFAPTSLVSPEDGGFSVGIGTRIEVPISTVNALTFYLKTLRPPARRDSLSPQVLHGEALFASIGCSGCHTPTLTTGDSPIAALHRVQFHPYTDLLLHDMGNELDDGYTEGFATSSEWRTSPLWGLGLRTRAQGGRLYLLHDGRARSIDEAIQFHGGESARARHRYQQLPAMDRAALNAFLESL